MAFGNVWIWNKVEGAEIDFNAWHSICQTKGKIEKHGSLMRLGQPDPPMLRMLKMLGINSNNLV